MSYHSDIGWQPDMVNCAAEESSLSLIFFTLRQLPISLPIPPEWLFKSLFCQADNSWLLDHLRLVIIHFVFVTKCQSSVSLSLLQINKWKKQSNKKSDLRICIPFFEHVVWKSLNVDLRHLVRMGILQLFYLFKRCIKIIKLQKCTPITSWK